jgi:hypothetical protein
MEATMQRLRIIGDKLWFLRSWLKASIDVARIEERHSAEPEQEEHPLDAMGLAIS